MCFSGSTLDSSVAGPRFEPHCPGRRSSGAVLGQRQAVGGVAASHRARAVVGRIAAGGWAHFFLYGRVHMISDGAGQVKIDERLN